MYSVVFVIEMDTRQEHLGEWVRTVTTIEVIDRIENVFSMIQNFFLL